MNLKKYQTYLAALFIDKFIKISLVFFCIIILVNFFEEIRFSEKHDVKIYYVFYLSLLNAPSLIFEILPFIFFVSAIFFYIQLNDNHELEIFNSNGISNIKIIPGDYQVNISSKLISQFINKEGDVNYWIALEKTSTFGV